MSKPFKLSIIIPIGPSEENILHLNSWIDKSKENWQWIVSGVEGAENQQIIENQLNQNFIKVFSSAGRARQLNEGAKKASGDFIWFLHCDSEWNNSVFESVEKIIETADNSIHFFRLQFKGQRPPWMFLNEWGVRIRSEFFKIPFGDQGFLMPQKVFWSLGGYDQEAEYGEDHLLIWQAHKMGIKVKPINRALKTSARKYQDLGWSQVTRRHLKLTWKQAKPELKDFLANRIYKLPF